MLLRKLVIERKTYGEHIGKCLGEITFDDGDGAVTLNLTPERCEQLFALVADGIIDTARRAANDLLCNVIEHSAQLGLPPTENPDKESV